MGLNRSNLIQASQWALEFIRNLTGQNFELTPVEIADLAMDDILGSNVLLLVPDSYIELDSVLHKEFIFLRNLGFIPPESEWEQVQSSFDNSYLEEVRSRFSFYNISNYNYDSRLDNDV